MPCGPLRLVCHSILHAFAPYMPCVPSHLVCFRVLHALHSLLRCLNYAPTISYLCNAVICVRVLFLHLKVSLNFLLKASFKPHIKDNFIERSNEAIDQYFFNFDDQSKIYYRYLFHVV